MRLRSAVRAAAIGALVAAAFVIALFVVRTPPAPALHAVGVRGGLDLQGGMAIEYELPAGTDPRVVAMLRERIVDKQPGGRLVERGGGVVELELPGIGASEAAYLADVLAGGGLQFRAVISDAPVMRKLYAHAVADPVAAQRGITATPDSWIADEGGKQTDYYLYGDDPKAIDAYIAGTGIAIPDDAEILYERIDHPPDWAGRDRPYWRSYLVERRVDLDGWAVADAVTSYDPQTGRPLVLVDFTRDGTAAFAELTRRSVGKKIATVIGGRIASAPIVNGPILGGRCSITMGGASAQQQDHDAAALASVLRMGPLPPGGTLRRADYVAPSVTAARLWLARALVGAAVGVIVFGVGFVLSRRSTVIGPGAIGAAAATRPAPVRALLVTVGGLAAVWMSTWVHLPMLNRLDLDTVVPDPDAVQDFSVFALGLAPLIVAFVVVEIAVLAVPAWRRHRPTPRGRRAIGIAVVCVAIAIGVAQGWSLARRFDRMSEWTTVWLNPPGTRSVAVVALSCATATLILGAIAAAISEYGLGNGFAVVLAAQPIVAIARAVIAAPPAGATAVVAVLLIAVVAAATTWLVRRRFGAAEGTQVIAPAGLVPVLWVIAAWAIVNAAIAIHVELPRGVIEWLATRGPVTDAVIVVVLTVAVAWLGARPAVSAALYGRMTSARVAPDHRAWAWAAAANAIVLLALFAVALGASPVLEPGVWTWIGIAIATVAVLDVGADWRARRRAELVGVWPIHDVALADTAAAVLARAGIAAHLRGRHTRTLFSVFGSFVPIEVMVPAERAGEASALLKDMFDPAARGVTTAW